MESSLATSADAELILKLYKLRTEAVMRQARQWVINDFWPTTTDKHFSVLQDQASSHGDWLRQVTSYWEMAAAFVLHGALSPELFSDCHDECFFLLAKFKPLLDEIRARDPLFLAKSSQLVERFSAAATRYALISKNVELLRHNRTR